jgi:hypothetical protein
MIWPVNCFHIGSPEVANRDFFAPRSNTGLLFYPAWHSDEIASRADRRALSATCDAELGLRQIEQP